MASGRFFAWVRPPGSVRLERSGTLALPVKRCKYGTVARLFARASEPPWFMLCGVLRD
jgi:hypothetical protein